MSLLSSLALQKKRDPILQKGVWGAFFFFKGFQVSIRFVEASKNPKDPAETKPYI